MQFDSVPCLWASIHFFFFILFSFCFSNWIISNDLASFRLLILLPYRYCNFLLCHYFYLFFFFFPFKRKFCLCSYILSFSNSLNMISFGSLNIFIITVLKLLFVNSKEWIILNILLIHWFCFFCAWAHSPTYLLLFCCLLLLITRHFR